MIKKYLGRFQNKLLGFKGNKNFADKDNLNLNKKRVNDIIPKKYSYGMIGLGTTGFIFQYFK
jgi:hypothetical protein